MTLETQAAFAERIGKDKSHVTRLKQSGRLVMDGNRVDVERSLAMIDNTASQQPHHIANATRLEVERNPAAPVGEDLAEIGIKQKRAQLRKMEADAAVAEYNRGQIEGSLCHVETVKRTARRHGDLVRRHVEAWPDRYAAELAAEVDAGATRAILAEACELLLDDLANELQRLAESLKEGE